ncbi:MAG: TolC family protein [Myxococcota bacterium]
MISILPLLLGATATATGAVSLDDVVARALQRSEDPRIAAARVEQAKATLRSVWSDLLPVLSANGTYRRRAFEVVINRENDDGTVERGVLQANDAFSGNLRLQSTLFSPRSIPDVQAAEVDVDAARADLDVRRFTLAHDTAEAFISVSVAEAAVGAAERRLEAAREDLEAAEVRSGAGLIDEVARTRVKIEALQAESELVQLRDTARAARLALGLIVGEPIEAPLAPFESVLEVADPEALVARALIERPEVMAAEAAVSAAEDRALAPWLAILPTLGLDGIVTATNETGFNGRDVNWNIALTLDWTIYDGGSRYAEARDAVAELEVARLERQALRRTIETEVRETFSRFRAAQTDLALAERRAAVSRRYAEFVRVRLERGLATAVEAADAAVEAFSADVDAVTGRAEVGRAMLALRRAAGRWPTAAAM